MFLLCPLGSPTLHIMYVSFLPSFSVIFISIKCCKGLTYLRRNVRLRAKALITTKIEFLSWHYPAVFTVPPPTTVGIIPKLLCSNQCQLMSFFSSKVVLSKVVKRVLLVCLARPASVNVLSLEDIPVARLLAAVDHPWFACLATCGSLCF